MEKRGGKIDRQFPLCILYVNRQVKCLWVRARCCCSCHRASLQHEAIRIYSSTESTDTGNRDNDDDGNATNNSFQLWLHIASQAVLTRGPDPGWGAQHLSSGTGTLAWAPSSTSHLSTSRLSFYLMALFFFYFSCSISQLLIHISLIFCAICNCVMKQLKFLPCHRWSTTYQWAFSWLVPCEAHFTKISHGLVISH